MGWQLWSSRAGADCKMQWVKLILQETLLSRKVLVVFPGTSEKCISRINTVARLTMNMQWFSLWHYLLPQNIKSPNSCELIWAFHQPYVQLLLLRHLIVLSTSRRCSGQTRIPRLQQMRRPLQSQWASSTSYLYLWRNKNKIKGL